MNKIYILLVFSFFSVSQGFSQGKITVGDANEIVLQTKLTIKDFENLLNVIAFPDNTASEISQLVENSYKPSTRRIFYNKNVILEDDINPDFKLGDTKDITAEKYLNDFDLQYQKSPDASVEFSNIEVSNIKQRDYVYVKATYTSKFSATHNLKKIGYNETTREALIRLEGQGNNQWKAFIVGITFHNPANPINTQENNVEVTTDISDNATVVSAEDLKKAQDIFLAEREEALKKQEAAFKDFMDLASAALLNKRYKEALEYLEKAKEIKSMVPALEKRILDTKRLVAEYTYENLKNKADQAKRDRKFIEAISLYKEALVLNQGAFSVIDAEIKPLAKKVEEIALPKGKLESQDFEGAISSSESLLKANKKIKNQFPELYYIQAVAYEALFKRSPQETKIRDKAFENYNLAIEAFSNYTDARVARAQFYQTYRNDLVSAIADYDVLTTNTLDISPDKPKYFAAKAKLKATANNVDGAIADYLKAIELSPKTASFYCDLGELQFKNRQPELALKNLTTAISLNPVFGDAFYFRGLNYLEQKDAHKAGLDFIEAEKIGLKPDQLTMVESISQKFFTSGDSLLNLREFKLADSTFNTALEIRKCNSLAWHGKAQLRFLIAEELGAQWKPAESKKSYQEAISLYRQAIVCAPAYSIAQLHEGLAHTRIQEYDLALKSFSEAIKNDQTNVLAFIERGNTKQVIKQYAEAAEDYNSAISLLNLNLEAAKKDKNLAQKITDDLSNVYTLYAEAHYNIQQYPAAMVAVNKAIEFKEDNAEAIFYKAQVLEAQDDLDKALKGYSEAIKIAPHLKYYYANGTASFKSKNYLAAIANFDEAIRLDTLPIRKDNHYLRGLSYFKVKMLDKALTDFSQYAKTEEVKKDSVFYADFGLLHLYLNDDSLALKHFNHALKFNNNNPQALFGVACVYAKAGDFPKALEMMESAYKTGLIRKDQFELEEDTFLGAFNKVKANRSKYNTIKKTYTVAN